MAKSWKSSVDFLDKFVSDSYKLTPEQKYFTYKGILFPAAACKLETIQALETFEARHDDIILCGYAKTGTNWVEHILNHLAITAAKYTEEEVEKRISIARELAMTPRLEFGDPDKFKKMENLPSRRIIITHLHPNMLPTSIFRNKAKVLVLIRNPKDTVVSFYHFRNKLFSYPMSTWDEYFTDFMNGKVPGGSYFDYVKEWDKYIDDENIMGISYEELKENLSLGVKKIAKFFGLSLNKEEIESVVENSSIDALKERAHETHGLIGTILFNKGHVGNWKSIFTKSQSQAMDKKFEEHLAGTKLGAKLKYEVYGIARCEEGAPPFEDLPVPGNAS